MTRRNANYRSEDPLVLMQMAKTQTVMVSEYADKYDDNDSFIDAARMAFP